MATEFVVRGTEAEQELFGKLRSRYDRSVDDLNIRRKDFDTKDELFRTFIDEGKWPYRAQVADPSTFTYLVEKTSRLINNKIRGKVIPREGSDWIKAKVVNEVLDYQWDLASTNGSMIQKWAMMDHNTRKYGAAFGLVRWNYEVMPGDSKPISDNPEFEVLSNRDVLVNPDHSSVRDWFMVRRYVTLEELQNINKTGRGKPKYKNLDLLTLSIKDSGKNGTSTNAGDRRDSNYQSRNKAMKGLRDTLGDDRYVKYLEILTQFTNDKVIEFSPIHGVIIREDENKFKEIPIVHLRYYMIDDDIYGLSEIEPIEKLQKVENALISQYLDSVNTDLYPPLLVRSTGVQFHTLEFGPNKKWLMNDPNSDVKRFDTSTASTGKFSATVSFIISRMANAMGETSEGISNIDPFSKNKTATEIRDSATQRLGRDQFNQIFLSEAVKRQMILWMKANSLFLDKSTMIRILGKDNMSFFQEQMLVPPTPDPMTGMPPINPLNGQPEPASPMGPDSLGNEAPIYPVKYQGEIQPKFQMDTSGQSGNLIVEPKDFEGLYDYIPDIESMSIKQSEDAKNKMDLINVLITPNSPILPLLLQEGAKPKIHDLLVEAMENLGFKDAKRFFETGQPQLPSPTGQIGGQIAQGQQPLGAGAGQPQGGIQPQGNVPVQGMAAGNQTLPGGQAGPIVPGPIGVQGG